MPGPTARKARTVPRLQPDDSRHAVGGAPPAGPETPA